MLPSKKSISYQDKETSRTKKPIWSFQNASQFVEEEEDRNVEVFEYVMDELKKFIKYSKRIRKEL